VGIDHYYCRTDFADDRLYDGNWGIYDEPFFQFTAKVLNKKPEPFLAVLYNISSHVPFQIPAELQGVFQAPGQTAAQHSISYVDYAFRHFFETAKRAPWFRHTIFVFCADHYLYPNDGSPYNSLISSTIPIFMYDPSLDRGGQDSTLISQVDITPLVLDKLGYTGHYLGFGTDPLEGNKAEHYAINKAGAVYQVITRDYVLGYDMTEDKGRYLHRYGTDPLLQQNLIDSPDLQAQRQHLETLIRANIQCFNQALLRRSLE